MNGQGSMQAQKRRKNIREISPIDVYKYLPKTNCGDCGESNCMAFATRVVNGELIIAGCPPLQTDEYLGMLEELTVLLAPPVQPVTFGEGENTVTIGGKYVLQRHEFTYHNPSPIAIDVHDLMPEDELLDRVRQIERFSYNYIGRRLAPDAIAIRSTSRDPETFRQVVKKVAATCTFPLVLCAWDPVVMEAGLAEIPSRIPLVYAATKDNWRSMADLALRYHVPLVVSSPGNLSLLRSLTKTLLECGISDLVLDPGTLNGNSLADTVATFTLIRTEATRYHDELFGFPLLGAPAAVWAGDEISEDLLKWREAVTASLLLSRYADLLILHSLDGWVLLPQLIWRFNLYTDPRKPVSVEGGVKVLGNPDRTSPVLVTTNYALTYFTVESDIKAANLDCYLVVIDTGGLSVESAVAGRILTAESIASALVNYQVKNLVDHAVLIIPGLAARISGEAEETTGWQIRVGPKDSSGLSKYIRDHWPPQTMEEYA